MDLYLSPRQVRNIYLFFYIKKPALPAFSLKKTDF
jgi:hypothetical protein